MSSKKTDSDSPDLVELLKEEIPIEDIRDYASPQRINSIDFVKGFAIIMIMIAHTTGAWLDKDWLYTHGLAYACLDILGPSLFVFLSALSVIFSVRRKRGRLPEKVIRNRIFSRGISIMAIGFLYNVIGLSVIRPDIPFPLNIWGWNILVFLGFSQIFSYYALKLKKMPRLVIGLLIIFITPALREFIYVGKDSNMILWILHFIITSPAPQITLLPWLAVCFISTIFGEYLYDAMIEGPDAYSRLFKRFLIWGIILVVVGVLLGLKLQTPETMSLEEYPHLQLYVIANQQNYYKFPGMPEFLIRGTIGNMFYNLGAALLIIAISLYLIDMKKKDNNFTKMIIYYGKASLSLFLIHYVFLALFFGQFSIIFAPIVVFGFIAFMGFFMYIWNEYGGGFGSPEWIMIQISRIGQKAGQTVKKEIKEVEEFIVKEGKKVEEKIKEAVKKKKKSKHR